ncbi:MAG: insulinase family protein [Bacilli bacterium]|nr:insulinase family protein [Bacilli bacterium]
MKTLTLPTKPIFIKNENFQTILINIIFPYQEKEEELAKQALLPAMLVYMTEKYPTEELFQKKLKENYILSYSARQITIGTTAAFNFHLEIPDKKTLKKDVIEKQVELFSEAIFHPKIENEGFDNFELKREKENLKLKIRNSEKSFKAYLNNQTAKLVDNEGIFSRNLKDHLSQIDEITPQNLYDYWKEKIKNNTPIIFIMGNIEEKEITPIIEKYFIKYDKEYQTLETDYIHYLTPYRTTPQKITEEKEFRDSAISLIYKVKDMKQEDNILLSLVHSLLTSLSSRLLNKKLRDEYNLIYSSEVTFFPNYGLLKITAYINPKNKDIVVEKIKEVLNSLKNQNKITPLLEKIKERRRINLIRSLDNKYSIMNDNIFKTLKIDYTSEESYNLLKEKTAKDVAEFIDRLSLDTTYFLKESDKHE